MTLDTKDTTQALQTKIQGKLRDFHKKGKLDSEAYKSLYPSSSVTPTANPAIKAHKPEKQYPARLITSHIGAPQENVASFINKILGPFIEKNQFVCKNSFEFAKMMKNIKLGPNEKMGSYDATALFPSVPIEEAIAFIRSLLENDPSLPLRTSLSPTEICELISLCLSSSNFLYDSRHHTQNNSGPIGLSLMVTVSQLWMIHTMEKAIENARERGTTIPRFITIYMDDVWCVIQYGRQGLRNSTASDPAVDFNECLNAVHPSVQFTREMEENNSIPFLDVLLTREPNGKISTKVYRKPSNTNITIKPQSCQHPSTAIANFKGELCRAHRICSSQENLKKEIEFIINLFADNGHKREMLGKMAKDYTPPSLQQQTSKNKKQSKSSASAIEDIPDNLFDILPFRGVNIGDEPQYKPYACVPFIPGPTHYRLKRAFSKAGANMYTKSGTKLKDLLCSANTTKHDPIKKLGIYEIKCPCSDKAKYVGQTARAIITRGKEHGSAANKGNWSHSGISAHKEHCKESIDWTTPTGPMEKYTKTI